MSVRKPAVAGYFYPSDPEELARVVHDCYLHPLGPGKLPPAPEQVTHTLACVVPHAALMYSGPVAAHSYLHLSALRKPDLAIVVAPNHNAVGSGVSAYKQGFWETPLGKLRVDEEAAAELAEATGIVDFDPLSHRMEHSLEVQLPFLQQLYGHSVPILPVSIYFQDPETTKILGEGVAKVASSRKALLIASSDLTHYAPLGEAKDHDLQLMKHVENLDVDGFYSTLERLEINSCGPGAIATVMNAAKTLGFKRGELMKYATSGDTTGDLLQVVGYASVRFL